MDIYNFLWGNVRQRYNIWNTSFFETPFNCLLSLNVNMWQLLLYTDILYTSCLYTSSLYTDTLYTDTLCIDESFSESVVSYPAYQGSSSSSSSNSRGPETSVSSETNINKSDDSGVNENQDSERKHTDSVTVQNIKSHLTF